MTQPFNYLQWQIKLAAGPMIGIWWYDAKTKEVYDFSVNARDVPGQIKDSPPGVDHATMWTRLVNSSRRDWKSLEYNEIPRGRVVYDGRYIIQTGANDPDMIRAVDRAFNLRGNYEVFIDAHEWETVPRGTSYQMQEMYDDDDMDIGDEEFSYTGQGGEWDDL